MLKNRVKAKSQILEFEQKAAKITKGLIATWGFQSGGRGAFHGSRINKTGSTIYPAPL